MRKRNNKSGFTLVELMVVAVIVSILAAVSIPLMTANKKRAMATEAEASLGAVRSSLRAMFAQTDAYNIDLNGNPMGAGPIAGAVPGVAVGDLDGRFFDDASYAVTAVGATTFTLTASGDNSTAPQGADVAGVVVTINEAGAITRSGL